MPAPCKKEFITALKEKLAQNKLDNENFARSLNVTVHSIQNYLTGKSCPKRNNVLGMREPLRLSISDTQRFLDLAGREPLTAEEIKNIEESNYIWHPYREDYNEYVKKMPSHSVLEQITKHIFNHSNPLLILTAKAQFHNIHVKILKGFIAQQFPKGNFLEVVPPYIEDEAEYFSSLAEQLNLTSSKPIKNNNDFKTLLGDFIKEKATPTFLLIRHLGNVRNAEVFARTLRSIIDTVGVSHIFYPFWIAGEKLEVVANKPTDSIFSIGKIIYYKAEATDIQLLAYEWEIKGVDRQIIDKIFELTGGHYMSIEFCLDFFEEKNCVPTLQTLKEYLLNLPLFNDFVDHKEALNKLLQQEIINAPLTYLAFFPIIKTLYFDGLLKKINETQFAWVNPTIRQIGLEMMENIL